MPADSPIQGAWSALSKAAFDIEGDDQLAAIRQQFLTEPTEEPDKPPEVPVEEVCARWEGRGAPGDGGGADPAESDLGDGQEAQR